VGLVILIDYREETDDKKAKNLDLIQHIQRIGVRVEKADLLYGDAAFEGRGPLGTISVGIERKRIANMLGCIDDAQYSAHQRVGMKQMYTVSALIIEGHWKPHDPDGILMEGFNGGISWGFSKYRSQRTMYHKLYRYLISVALSGVIVTYSRDPFHTAFNICEWFHYFDKPWSGHTSLQEMQKVAIPTLNGRPSLTRKWAADLGGVDRVLSERIEEKFHRPVNLALASEEEWLSVPGIGARTAKKIVAEIWKK
jgi:ERCC4-type nuclease